MTKAKRRREGSDRKLRSGLQRFLLVLVTITTLLFGQAAHKPARKLVVISVVGLDERFLSESAARVKIPNIRKLIRQGAVSSGVVGVVPSDTWPSQIALVTGLPPAADAATETPLWVVASNGGLRTASIYWPGTAGANIAFDFPAIREVRKGQNIQFAEVAQKASPSGIADRIEKTSTGFEKELWDDSSAARAAVYLLKNERPDFLLVQLSEVDSEQRETGALSVYARDALDNDDELIGQILAAAAPSTVVALVSGHGFENENYVVRPKVLLKQGKRNEAKVEVRDGLIGTADRPVADRLRKLMADGHRHGLAREIPMSEVKARAPGLAHWVAAFDTPPNYVAKEEDRGPALGPGSHLGISGQWPARPNYRSVFVIAGEGIPARKLGEIDLLQIAPTLADVIGGQIPKAAGKSLWPSISR